MSGPVVAQDATSSEVPDAGPRRQSRPPRTVPPAAARRRAGSPPSPRAVCREPRLPRAAEACRPRPRPAVDDGIQAEEAVVSAKPAECSAGHAGVDVDVPARAGLPAVADGQLEARPDQVA